jgi:hypothetical protein
MNDFVKKFMSKFQENVVQGSQHYIVHYEHLKQQAEARLYKAQNEYRKKAKRWGYIHRFLGIAAVLFSVASAVFTFSTSQEITATLSLLSAVFSGLMTFLNPSDKEVKFRTSIGECLSFYNDVCFASIFIHNNSTSDNEKLKRLEDLNHSLKFLDQKLAKII